MLRVNSGKNSTVMSHYALILKIIHCLLIDGKGWGEVWLGRIAAGKEGSWFFWNHDIWGAGAVSWKQLQYFITAARPSIKSKNFSSLFQSLTATNATNDECGWRMSYWNYIQTQFSFSLCFSFPLLPLCQFLKFTTMLKKIYIYIAKIINSLFLSCLHFFLG